MSEEKIERFHIYHAEAAALEGNLRLPFVQQIYPETYSKLNERGGYVTQRTENYHLGGIVSFRSAYTQVAGNPADKPGHGWNTLTTSVVEGFNVMDVVTVDRIVAQISTDHPLIGYVPRVTLLGTRFENLRIAGHPVKLSVDTNILGPKPAEDAPYTSDPGFLERVRRQREAICSQANVPSYISESYNQVPSSSSNRESIECSLVNQVEGSFPGRSFGHLIDIPDFGRIYLGTLGLTQSKFKDGVPTETLISLMMMKIEMGCVGGGVLGSGSGKTNGATSP